MDRGRNAGRDINPCGHAAACLVLRRLDRNAGVDRRPLAVVWAHSYGELARLCGLLRGARHLPHADHGAAAPGRDPQQLSVPILRLRRAHLSSLIPPRGTAADQFVAAFDDPVAAASATADRHKRFAEESRATESIDPRYGCDVLRLAGV